jgi:integrase
MQRLHTLGRVEDFKTVEDARKAAQSVRQDYAKGEDVIAERKREETSAKHLRELLEEWLAERQARKAHKPSTAADIRRAAKDGWSGWLDKPILELTETAVLRRHSKRSQAAPRRANLEMRYLRALWRWTAANYKELGLGPAPTSILNERRDWNPEKRKQRRVETEDLAGWIEAVEKLKNTRARDFFLFLLYTGARSGETRALEWRDIDLARGTYHLANPKNKQAVTLPLSAQAADVLRRRYKENSGSQWVFPAVNREGEEGPMTNPSTDARLVSAASGVTFSPHDLRRSFISFGASQSLRIHPATLRALTNHAPETRDSHLGYHVPELAELRRATQAISDYITSAVAGNPVVELPRRA